MKTDRRVKMTNQLLKDALIELLQEKHISKISVKSLCERADINRSTFYAHFADQYALLEQITSEALGNIRNYIDSEKTKLSPPITAHVLTKVIYYIQDNLSLFNALLSENSGLNIQGEIMSFVEVIPPQVYAEFDQEMKEYVTVFWINGSVSLLRQWLATGTPHSPEQISEILINLIHSGIANFPHKI